MNFRNDWRAILLGVGLVGGIGDVALAQAPGVGEGESLVENASRQNAGTAVQARAAAHAFFEKAKRLMAVEDYAEACPLLERSQALDAGIGTQLYLADCYRLVGRPASAWITFKDAEGAARTAKDEARAQVAQENANDLEPLLSWLVLNDSTGVEPISGLVVTLNGTAMSVALLGVSFPVDPGPIVVVASAPGYLDWGMQVDIHSDASRHSLTIPELSKVSLPVPIPPVERRAPVAIVPRTVVPLELVFPQPEPSQFMPSTRSLSLLSAGGLVTAFGIYFGVSALKDENSADEGCVSDGYCSRKALGLIEDAQGAARLANISYLVGGALLVGGGWSLWAESSDVEPSERAQFRLRVGMWQGTAAGAQLAGEF